MAPLSGQPRQDDLLAYLVDKVPPERLEALRELLQIDLRPGHIGRKPSELPGE